MKFIHKILIPFASKGDKYNIPDEDLNGFVNQSDGFSFDYAKPERKGGKYIKREEVNGLFYNTQAAIKEIQDKAIDGSIIEDGKVLTVKIANGAVTEAKLASNAVSTAKIVNGAVTEAKLASNAVSTAKIANGAVTEAKLASNAVSTAKIANGAVTADKIHLPVGFVYVQFPHTPAPGEIFRQGTWQNISTMYDGAFFRAEGGLSETFNIWQGGGLPNIKGTFTAINYMENLNTTNAFYLTVTDGLGFPSRAEERCRHMGYSFDASRSNPIYGAATEVRPRNYAVRIWKKIS